MSRRALAAAALFVLLAAGSGAAVAATGHSARPSRALFGNQLLLPGKSIHANITIRGARAPIRPFLQVSSVRQRCAAGSCTGAPIALAASLDLSAADGAGHIWTGTFADAQRRITLPGGTIGAGGRRTYHLTVSLPAGTSNSYQGIRFRAGLHWGGLDASGAAISASRPSNSTLPFTGFDAVTAVALAGLLLGVGATLLETARRRRAQ
jgi:hypothetical protein